MKTNTINRGNSTIIVIILVVLVAFVGASAFSYFYLKSNNLAGDQNPLITNVNYQETKVVSDANDVETLEKELDATNLGTIDSDLESLNKDASAL